MVFEEKQMSVTTFANQRFGIPYLSRIKGASDNESDYIPQPLITDCAKNFDYLESVVHDNVAQLVERQITAVQ